jgi:diguanylate cyclase (GGDEF)-like protein
MVTLINDEVIVEKPLSREVQKSEEELKMQTTLKGLNMLSKQVVGKLSKDQVPPTPENYKIYFDAQLDNKPESQKKDIKEILSLEADVEGDHAITLEKDIQNAFVYLKNMTDSIATVYTKINQMKKITQEKEEQLRTNPSRLALVSYEEDLSALSVILDRELDQIKRRYNTTAGLIKNFNQNSIYDKKYGVYNKKYLLKTLDSILKSVENFDTQNTILSIKIGADSFFDMPLKRDRMLINVTLAKLLLKRSRRSDIITHYDDDIFIIVLKHTDVMQAQVAIDRITDMIESANFIVDAKSVDVKLQFGIAAIDKSLSKEEILIEAIDNL